ncbi:CueP family metal-binding protein [Brachybacterium sp. FME24]|uniref:CueP family metal-binding protein n=1 Tax=Brachybacterium sp. FME24 TaxID=2742605 RepID=UPI0018682999|nr:CueP family metal-binding protein [Brachybacterium sp. FME24]
MTSPSTTAIARRALFAGLTLTPLVLVGCASTGTDTGSASGNDLLRDLGFDGMNGREIIDELEALPIDQRPADVLAAVHPDELALSDASGREARIPLPDEEFYVSVAPFLEVTHDCHVHSLTTCTGELPDQNFEVLVTDASGEALLEHVITTNPNGFFGMWLPRDRSLTLTCSQDDMSATTALSTRGDEAATCLTTLQLTA